MSKVRLQTLKARLQPIGDRMPVMQPGSWRTDKQSSTQRGYGYRWQVTRAAYLEHHPFCVFCMRDARIESADIAGIILECAARGVAVPYASVVDHTVPHRGDMALFWDKTKWQSLCAHHHSAEKQRQEAGFP